MAAENTTTATVEENTTTETTETEVMDTDAGKAALKKERARASAAEKELKAARDRVKEFEDKDKSDSERAAQALTEAEAKAAMAERKAAAYEAAVAENLDPKFATRLVGETTDELREDAKQFRKQLPSANGGSDFEGGARTTARPSDMDSAIRQAAGRG